MMAFKEWVEAHAQKHQIIVTKLKTEGKNQNEIIEYFRFENMVQNEPTFCKLYKLNEKCHEMDDLNCFLCACPHFRYSEDVIEEREDEEGEELYIYTQCAINHKNGATIHLGSSFYQDCTNCSLPHEPKFVAKNYSENLMDAMHLCEVFPEDE
jgi:hypothetical protein